MMVIGVDVCMQVYVDTHSVTSVFWLWTGCTDRKIVDYHNEVDKFCAMFQIVSAILQIVFAILEQMRKSTIFVKTLNHPPQNHGFWSTQCVLIVLSYGGWS